MKAWDKYNSVDGTLNQQLLESVHPMDYRGLRNRYTGYDQINTRVLLVHMYTTYSKIGPEDLKENEKRI